MMSRSILYQIFLIVVSVMVFALFVRPMIEEIRKIQDKIFVYETELQRVNGVNEEIERHISVINNLSISDRQALERYIPGTLDEIAILRDIESILNERGVIAESLDIKSLASESIQSPEESEASSELFLPYADFSLSTLVSYAQVKDLLQAIEVNSYPLEVQSLVLTPTESGLLSTDLTLRAYALRVELSDVPTTAPESE